ncbi:multidrug DMT transporter permease [Winogradskyella sp. SM1960]|uniref:multidrug DMT transporter permease n=1 Tax=Winogradskyella sp. SM1960 TaxID=2865955 RepID=UPI001CD1F896|nr:multidrug DMT transporter permease [Winogradskyella sp. SM1960]
MFIIDNYFLAVFLCVITMLCWGSWANTQKLASKKWGFPLFYWDYTLGVVLLSLVFGLTLGSNGEVGQSFLPNLGDASINAIFYAFLGGVIFNIANLLLVAAIEIAGMAIAFPIGIGIALVLGVIVNYVATPLGDPLLLFIGVGLVTLAIILDALIYKRISKGVATTKGIVISLAAGVLMGFFYRFVAASMSVDFSSPTAGLLTPYTAVFIFSIGILISNFVFNTFFMYKPISGDKVTYKDYFKLGTPKLHLIGVLGGAIWCLGFILNMIAAGEAGFAISYGLGQGATMVAAIWGIFIWKEFKEAPTGTNKLIGLMFLLFIVGLSLIIMAKDT